MVEVVVVGAGYAGVIAANRLVGHETIRVTMVNPTDRFVQRIRLHEVAAGSATSAELPLASVLNQSVTLVESAASSIDSVARTVRLSDGNTLSFDYLIYAAGSGCGIPPSDGKTHVIASAADAMRLRERLAELPEAATIEVIGGGLTGIETATEIAEKFPRMRVSLRTSGQVAPSVSDRGRRHIRSTLRRLGVRLSESAVGGEFVADVVVRCTGFTVPSLAADSGLPVDEHGRLMVDATLRVPGADRVFGAGDGAMIDAPGFEYHRMACASALPMGGHVANGILRLIDGRAPEPHSNGYLLQCISLGRKDALVQFVRRDDTPISFVLTGRVGAWVKETICRQTVKWMRGEARRSGSFSWAKGPRTLAAARAESIEVGA